jgi:hypothetical protein
MTDDIKCLLSWLFIVCFGYVVWWAYAGAVQWQ